MIKNILIVCLLIISFVGNATAFTDIYSMDSSCSICGIQPKANCPDHSLYSANYGGSVNYTIYRKSTIPACWLCDGVSSTSIQHIVYSDPDGYIHRVYCGKTTEYKIDINISGTVSGGNIRCWINQPVQSASDNRCQKFTDSVSMVISNEPVYTVSGHAECINNVSLYIYNTSSSSYVYLAIDSDEYYSMVIFNNTKYKIIFSDEHEYEFTVNNSNVMYDYDGCSHTQYRFEESCGNLIPDSEGLYIENYGLFGDAIKDFFAPNGILDIANTSADFMYVYTDTFIGKTGWIIDPVEDGYTYTLENPNIAWGLKVIVINESDGELIDGAMVKVDQDCYCTSGYSTRQKMTVNGMVEYGDMSLQDASLFVMATGYKILDENTTGYSAFLSGRTNFSSKTWIVKMAPTWSNNTSTFYEPQYKVDIHFKNEDGNRTSQILDTDTEVYLYYENNNSEEEAMTLKFQSSSTHSHFIDEDSWTIAHDTIGHKTISNADFTPWTYAYRAIIYNSSVYGWNITIPLTVRNETKEETIHYENLTTNLWFTDEKDGKIDYREDMQIVSHARSNNTTLMTIDLEVWKDGALLCYTNLTETDYENADFPYYYVYEPVYDYVAGSNYTTKMYGFDRTLLEVRYLEVINDTVTRKNKLTIGVKDRFGANLDNCYIYLEGWGSLPTGTTYYNAYEGISNGDYRYKATKSGYTDSGWSDVTLTDGDQIVWYTLSQDVGNVSVSAQKFTDEDIKGFFFPLMYFLLICIIFGGLKYVTQ